MCLASTILIFFCGNQNVYVKFLNQNGCQFRLHVRRPVDTVGVTCTVVSMTHAWVQDVSLGAAAPPRGYVPALLVHSLLFVYKLEQRNIVRKLIMSRCVLEIHCIFVRLDFVHTMRCPS